MSLNIPEIFNTKLIIFKNFLKVLPYALNLDHHVLRLLNVQHVRLKCPYFNILNIEARLEEIYKACMVFSIIILNLIHAKSSILDSVISQSVNENMGRYFPKVKLDKIITG